jgi:hypothetical protein
MCNAAVALHTATAKSASQRSAIARSKRSMVGPWVSQSDCNTATTASMSA